MPLGDRGWRDSTENYCDSYVLKVNGSTATAVLANSYTQPAVLFGISITLNPAVGSGLVDIRDSSATGDNDTTVWSVAVASAASQVFKYTMAFPRGLALDKGIVVTATTCSGSVSLLYKARYS